MALALMTLHGHPPQLPATLPAVAGSPEGQLCPSGGVAGAAPLALVRPGAAPLVLAGPQPKPELLAEADEKLNFCRLVLEYSRQNHCGRKLACAAVATRVELFPRLLLGGHHGRSLLTHRNLQEWLKRLGDANGKPNLANRTALVDAPRPGRPTTVSLDHPFIREVARFYLNQNKLELAECYRQAKHQARAKRFHPEMMLSEFQVGRFFRRQELADMIYLARYGEDAFREARMDWIDRDWSAVAPGECLCMDHHQFDCGVRIPDGQGGWVAIRPWLSAGICNRALYFAGWVILAESPNCDTCQDVLLRATIANGNRPWVWAYMDNGKDYQARGFVEPVTVRLPDGKEVSYSILKALGTQPVTARAYNARAKVIERRFKEVAGKFAKYWFGYRGNCPGNRPWNGLEAWAHPELLPTLDEFTAAFGWWLEHCYHAESGEDSAITGGRHPAELWAQRSTARPALSDADLLRCFQRPLARNGNEPLFLVGRGGRIRLDHCTYQDAALWPWQDRKVLVKTSGVPGDEAIYCFEPAGRPICRAAEKAKQAAIAAPGAERERLSLGIRAAERQLVSARTQLLDLVPGENGKTRRVSGLMDRLQLASGPGAEAEAVRLVAAAERALPAAPTAARAATAESAPSVNTRELDDFRRAVAAIEESGGSADEDGAVDLSGWSVAELGGNEDDDGAAD